MALEELTGALAQPLTAPLTSTGPRLDATAMARRASTVDSVTSRVA